MKILILGASGMLGHKLLQILSCKYKIVGAVRNKSIFEKITEPTLPEIISGIDAFDLKSVTHAIDIVNPQVIINCIGIIKQLPEGHDPITTISINSLFPHHLAHICQKKSIRLIHYSTDCVFSGKIGNYSESDIPDADDLYGRSKLLGEITGPGCLTLRTSLIGREISGYHSLFEWLLQQEGKEIHGYTKAFFSGLTTIAHAHILEEIITNNPKLTGLYHVATDPISKYNLLKMIIERFNLNIRINPNDSIVCDRSLNGTQFINSTGIQIPSWKEMIEQMYNDTTPYHTHNNVHK